MKKISIILAALIFCGIAYADETVTAPGAEVIKLADGFGFTEGPTADSTGDVYFVDDPKCRIHRWSVADGKVSVFAEDTQHANGMYFDKNDILYACEGGSGSIVSYDRDAKRTVVADKFEGKRFNKPNDLWIAPNGGIYFTDPVYGAEFSVVQDGEHVYYISPDRSEIKKVVNDMIRPNGLIGTPDGKLLYITDEPARKVWRYAIAEDGSLTDKTLFAEVGVDGMMLDCRGNVYITVDRIYVYSPDGREIQQILVPEWPANLCFGGPERKTLYITARTGFYSIEMCVTGASGEEK